MRDNASASSALTIYVAPETRLPDNAAYTNRFEVRSETSDNVYIIAQSKSGRWWSCGCRGWIRHKKCKHLAAVQLPAGQRPYEVKLTSGREK